MSEHSGFNQEDRRLAAIGLAAQEWHLDKKVSISLIIAVAGIIGGMFVQTIYVTRYFSGLESRVSNLESYNTTQSAVYDKKQDEQDRRLKDLESVFPKIAVIDEKLSNISTRLDIQTTRMSQILDAVNKH